MLKAYVFDLALRCASKSGRRQRSEHWLRLSEAVIEDFKSSNRTRGMMCGTMRQMKSLAASLRQSHHRTVQLLSQPPPMG